MTQSLTYCPICRLQYNKADIKQKLQHNHPSTSPLSIANLPRVKG